VGIDLTGRPLRGAIFLDRDGVINRAVIRDGKPYPPDSVAELQVSEGVREALAELSGKGFLLFVVTNQPDVARGKQQQLVVNAIHQTLGESLPLDGFYVCFHDDQDKCGCRKPKPGLLLAAAAEHGISLSGSYMIGDRWRDIEAGQRAGCRTIWIDLGYAERGPSLPADAVVKSLPEAAAWILHSEHRKELNEYEIHR
jgi:D-glycero-D-manno-heptose 1,7-bisphosphate phosphatase